MKSPASSRLVSLGASQCVAIALRLKILLDAVLIADAMLKTSVPVRPFGIVGSGLHAMLAYAEVTSVVGERVTAVVRDFVLQEGSLGWCGLRPLMRECCVSPTLFTTRCNLLWGLFLDRFGM